MIRLISCFIILLFMFSCSGIDNRKVEEANDILRTVRLMDMNNSLPDNDSILDNPIQIFLSSDNSFYLAEAYYLKAKILKNNLYLLRAQDYFSKAEELAGNDTTLLFKINMEMANISRFKMLQDEEDSRLIVAESMLDNINDQSLKSEFLYEKALYYKKRDMLRDAKDCLYMVMNCSMDSALLGEVYKYLSRIYLREHDADSVIFFINSAIIECGDVNRSELNVLKTIAYTQKNEEGKVECLLYPSVYNVPLSMRVEAYRSVSSMYSRLGETLKSDIYLRKYVLAMDSLVSERKVDLAERINSMNEYNIEKEKASKVEFDMVYIKIMVYRITFITVIFIAVLLLILYRNHSSKRKLTEQLRVESALKVEESLKRKEAELALIRKNEELQQKEIDRLNKSISYYKQLNTITLPILMKRQNSQGALHLTEDEWSIIVENADACFDGFTLRLRNFCSSLTDDEIRFCCLVKMELPMTLLSEIYHIAKPSISRKKMRLKEKMSIENASFDEFISAF